MPILKLDKYGNVVEADARLNGDQGIGKTAEMVDSHDVTELSLEATEDWKKQEKDRQAVRKLQEQNRLNQMRKMVGATIREAQQKVLDDMKKEKLFREKKALEAKENALRSARQIMAARSAAQPDQAMSGVTGYGLAPDGRRPFYTQEAKDFALIEQGDAAFGRCSEDWGMGMQVDAAMARGNTKSLHKKFDDSYNAHFGEQQLDIDDSSDDNAVLTPEHEFIIKNFEKGVHTVSYTLPNHSYSTNKVFDGTTKAQIQRGSAQGVGQELMSKYISQGWGWSGYEENGEWVEVKIPYIYGLPYIRPENLVDSSLPYWNEASGYYNKNWINNASVFHNGLVEMNGETIKGTHFNMLKPVIKILAIKQKLNEQETQANLVKEAVVNRGVPAPQASAQAQGNFLERLFKALKEGLNAPKADYSHPMIKKGLVK